MIRKRCEEYFKGFLFPLISLEDWSSTYDINLNSLECPYCDNELSPETPYASKGYRGIIFEQCECEDYPKNQAPFRFTSSDPEERKRDREFAQSLYKNFDGECLHDDFE